MKNVKTLSPKLDVVFQALFGEVGNESITKGFLETILERKIDSIDLSRNPILRREFKDEKLGVLDIIVKLDENEICNIELQIVDKKNIIERILYYWSRLYSRQIKSGEYYKILQKAIVILITDFKLENLEELDYHSRWKIMEDKQGKKIILTQKLEIDIIELPKIIGKEKEQDNLLDWLYFLENPKSERVTEKMKENENLKEAVKKLDNLSEDEKMQRIADLRQKAIMDEKAIYEKGLEVGIEKGMKEGIQRGIEKGIEKGIMEGSQKEKIEIAKKMLELKIDKETIAKATGLTEQEIEKILD
jgi:predicted transposase/invertase (TIGR01784 family)